MSELTGLAYEGQEFDFFAASGEGTSSPFEGAAFDPASCGEPLEQLYTLGEFGTTSASGQPASTPQTSVVVSDPPDADAAKARFSTYENMRDECRSFTATADGRRRRCLRAGDVPGKHDARDVDRIYHPRRERTEREHERTGRRPDGCARRAPAALTRPTRPPVGLEET